MLVGHLPDRSMSNIHEYTDGYIGRHPIHTIPYHTILHQAERHGPPVSVFIVMLVGFLHVREQNRPISTDKISACKAQRRWVRGRSGSGFLEDSLDTPFEKPAITAVEPIGWLCV